MRALNRLLAAARTVLLVVGWLVLAPTTLGGSTTYVTTHGISMEPGFQNGDLALVRAADAYGVGDAVAYHSDQLDTTVLHRIVAVEDGRFTLQGDNNSWLDPDRPTGQKIIGSLALRVPRGGVWLARLTSPPALALLAFGIALAGGAATHTRRRKRRRTVPSHAYRAPRPGRVTGFLHVPQQLVPVVYTVVVAGLLGIVLGYLAWTGPSTETDIDKVDSDRSATFSYTAQVPPTAAYDDTTVSSPEPVFRKLAQDVEVAYSYRGEPSTVSVSAELAAANGWQMTIPLTAETTFDGTEYNAAVDLDLQELERRTTRAADAIGVPMDQVTVTVRPRFVGGETGAVFEPELPLSLSSTTLTLPDPASMQARDTATTTSETVARELSPIGRSISVETARVLSLVLLAAALLGGLIVAFVGRSMRTATEGAAIRQRYASALVQVQPMPVRQGRPVVDVTDIATLVKLAERYGLLVLHWSRADIETFVVQDEGTTYRYRTGAQTGSDTGADRDEHELDVQEV